MRAAIAMDVFMAILLTRTMAQNLLRYGGSKRPKRMVEVSRRYGLMRLGKHSVGMSHAQQANREVMQMY